MLARTFAAILSILFLLSAVPAAAQLPATSKAPDEATTLPGPLTPEAVRKMVAGLSEEQVKALLLQRLDAVATEAAEPDRPSLTAGLVDLARRATVGNIDSVAEAVERVPMLWDLQLQSFRTFGETLGYEGVRIMLIVMAFGIGAGLIAEFGFRRLTRRWVESSSAIGRETLRATVVFLLKRLSDAVRAARPETA